VNVAVCVRSTLCGDGEFEITGDTTEKWKVRCKGVIVNLINLESGT